MRADMVEMRVRRHGDQRPLGDQRHLRAQRHHPHPAVDQQVTIPPPHVPDVAAIELLDERLADPGDAVTGPTSRVPILGPDSAHLVSRGSPPPSIAGGGAGTSAQADRNSGVSVRVTGR